MLYDPHAHESLVEESWNPTAIQAAIRAIAEETDAAFDDGWAAHPLDDDEPRRFRTVYFGGAGVVRALHELQERGPVELRRNYVSYLDRDYVPDFPEHDHERSLLVGETGICLVLQRLAPSEANADRLAELIAENARDRRRELMWGSPRHDDRGGRAPPDDGGAAMARAVGGKRGMARGAVGPGLRCMDAGAVRQDHPLPRAGARLRRMRPRAFGPARSR